MKPGRIFWGLLTLGIGVFFLLVNLNYLPSDLWKNFIPYWPVIIILLGLSIAIKNALIYFLISILILGCVTFAAISHPIEKKNNNEIVEQINARINEKYSASISKLNLSLNLGAASISVGSFRDINKDSLVKANYDGFSNLEEKREDKESISNIIFKEKTTKVDILNFSKNNMSRNLDLKISDQIPVDLTVNTGASKLNLDLSNVNLEKVLINSGASNADVKFGNKSENLTAEINSGTSKFSFLIPKDFGLRIEAPSAFLSKYFEGINLERNSRKIYSTKDFDKATKKINIKISSGFSKITVAQY